MRLRLNVQMEVDPLTASRFLQEKNPSLLWKSLDLLVNTRPDLVTFTLPEEVVEGATDEASKAT